MDEADQKVLDDALAAKAKAEESLRDALVQIEARERAALEKEAAAEAMHARAAEEPHLIGREMERLGIPETRADGETLTCRDRLAMALQKSAGPFRAQVAAIHLLLDEAGVSREDASGNLLPVLQRLRRCQITENDHV